MGAGHSHGVPDGKNEKRLLLALLLTTGFLVAEVVGGILAGSLALISDAAHMFTDSAALAIALAAVRIGKRPADTSRTYGYYRFEILAAALNAILLFLVAIYIVYEAYQRFRAPAEIESTSMLAIAAVGLIVNLISMRVLSAGKDDSMNIKGAYLEVWSDMLGSAGVIVAALVIKWTGWTWVDSAVAVAIGLWVLPRTWILLKDSLNILLEGVPEGVGVRDINEALRGLPGVAPVHDLHVWAISSGKVSLTAHVVRRADQSDVEALLQTIRSMLSERYEIHHVTIQIEARPCDLAADVHRFGPEPGSAATAGQSGHAP
jgi:cobalt-zinc-cadmium efflux system protein